MSGACIRRSTSCRPLTIRCRGRLFITTTASATENFKPLAALGGALGIGVWQNVKDLYAFVCRNFQPGDQIYGFGFSRGVFTMRLLMGLIG
jgi:uncharacterized protein (DUF2235 family)